MFKIKKYYCLGIGDWGLGQSPIPNPQSPIPNPQCKILINYNLSKLQKTKVINNIVINFYIIIINYSEKC